jgi:hypothetical protein
MKREQDNERAQCQLTALGVSSHDQVSVLTWINNTFAALCGGHGDVTAQAEQAGCSRQTVFDHASEVQ